MLQPARKVTSCEGMPLRSNFPRQSAAQVAEAFSQLIRPFPVSLFSPIVSARSETFQLPISPSMNFLPSGGNADGGASAGALGAPGAAGAAADPGAAGGAAFPAAPGAAGGAVA